MTDPVGTIGERNMYEHDPSKWTNEIRKLAALRQVSSERGGERATPSEIYEKFGNLTAQSRSYWVMLAQCAKRSSALGNGIVGNDDRCCSGSRAVG